MQAYLRGHLGWLVLINIAVLTFWFGESALARAQEPPRPKWELYGGYSAFDPGAAIHGILPGGVEPSTACLCWEPRGFGAALTYHFLPWFGVSADISGAWGSHESDPFQRFDHASFYNLSAGPTFAYHVHHFSPFAEFLAGGHQLKPGLFHANNAFGFMAGGGVDFNLSKHFAFRMIHADYAFSNHQFGPSSLVASTGVRGARLQSGLVFMFGGEAAAMMPQAQAAMPQPQAAMAMPVIQAPTVVCSAMPMSVNAGANAMIMAEGTSPQHRPLTYSFNATAGSIIGTNATAILATAGAASGVITVTCIVTDDKANTAEQTTQVTVKEVAVAAKAETSALCSVSFGRDRHRLARVDNEAKGCLDDIALVLKRSPETTLAILGNAGAARSDRTHLAAQRAVNTKAYLVMEKGIDASRVTAYTGNDDADAVSNIAIPSGATLNAVGYAPVHEGDLEATRAPHGRRRMRSR